MILMAGDIYSARWLRCRWRGVRVLGRPESEIAAVAPALQDFAAELRRLRRRAGSPSYRQLAVQAHFSVSALSRAASGQSLPSLAVTLAFVRACGGDLEAWQERWQATATELAEGTAPLPVTGHRAGAADPEHAASAGTEPATGHAGSAGASQAEGGTGLSPSGVSPPIDPPAEAGRPPRGWTWLLARVPRGVIAAGAVALVGIVTISVNWWPGQASAGPVPCTLHASGNPGGPEPVADCSDPKQSGCGTGAVTLASVPVHVPADQDSGELELRYSASCRSAWARFSPAVGWQPGQGMQITVTTLRPADSRMATYTVTYGGPAIIGDMLLTGRGCVLAEVQMRRGTSWSPLASTDCLSAPAPATPSSSPSAS
jgi:Helix-turn-helix domain/Protein of unknown function (DUF2690)